MKNKQVTLGSEGKKNPLVTAIQTWDWTFLWLKTTALLLIRAQLNVFITVIHETSVFLKLSSVALCEPFRGHCPVSVLPHCICSMLLYYLICVSGSQRRVGALCQSVCRFHFLSVCPFAVPSLCLFHCAISTLIHGLLRGVSPTVLQARYTTRSPSGQKIFFSLTQMAEQNANICFGTRENIGNSALTSRSLHTISYIDNHETKERPSQQS